MANGGHFEKKIIFSFLHSLGSTKCIEQKTIDFV
jgi:hypothetical protein